MQNVQYSVFINAPKEKVWHAMLDEPTYGEWTEAFNSGSRYEGSWEKGAEIRFIGPDPETGKEGGMFSRIAENKPYEFISIEHLGILNDGIKDTTSEEAKKWAPAFENYTFNEKDGGTEVIVDIDLEEEYVEQFSGMWEEALKHLKNIAERT